MATTSSPSAPLDLTRSIADVMRPGVLTCARDTSLPRVAATMLTRGVHAVVVPSGTGTIPLVADDLGLLRGVLAPGPLRAGDIARDPVATLSIESTVEQAVAAMAVAYVSHLLVTAGDEAAGVVSSLDIVALLGGWDPRRARAVRPGPARPAPSAQALDRAVVGDVMHHGVASCPPDAPLWAVGRSMAEHRTHCVAVTGIDASTRPDPHLTWGLVESIDLVGAVHRGALDEPAVALAATGPLAVGERESLDRVARLMAEHGAAHVVVVGASGLPTGIVSTLDVAAILAAAA